MFLTEDERREAQAQAFVAYVRWFNGWSPPNPAFALPRGRHGGPTYGSTAWYQVMYRRSARRRQAERGGGKRV